MKQTIIYVDQAEGFEWRHKQTIQQAKRPNISRSYLNQWMPIFNSLPLWFFFYSDPSLPFCFSHMCSLEVSSRQVSSNWLWNHLFYLVLSHSRFCISFSPHFLGIPDSTTNTSQRGSRLGEADNWKPGQPEKVTCDGLWPSEAESIFSLREIHWI